MREFVKMERQISVGIFRITSKGGPEHSGRREPKQTFPFDFRPKIAESLASWKAPLISQDIRIGDTVSDWLIDNFGMK